MKKHLLKSFIAFLIFNSTFLISGKGQIVYTDVIPDTIVNTNGGVYHLDLNNDGTIECDITITTMSGAHPSAKIELGCGAMSNSLNFSSLNSAALGFGNLIANNFTNWNFGGNLALDYWGYSQSGHHAGHWIHSITGYWINATDKYLGLRFILGGNIYYGWARLDAQVTSNATATFTIKDYAYNSIPHQPILAGETTCTVPTVTLTPDGSLSICQGDNVTLKANGTGYQYQWKKNGVYISGATAKKYIVKTAGTYNVIVTNSCGSQTSNSSIVTVGLPCKNSDGSLSNNNDALEHLSVYPNPATNSVTIKIPPDSYREDEAGEIQIINLFGRVVETHNYASLRDSELQIDVSKFPAGMYMARWSSGENYETKTFSVIK